MSAIYKGTHIIKSRTFTPSVRQGIAKLSARAKSVVFALASRLLKIIKPQTHGKIAGSKASEIFVNKAAEPSDGLSGIAKKPCSCAAAKSRREESPSCGFAPVLSVRKSVPEPRGPAGHEKVTCFYTVYKFITILLQFLQVYYTTFPYNESIRQNLRKIKVVRRELS